MRPSDQRVFARWAPAADILAHVGLERVHTGSKSLTIFRHQIHRLCKVSRRVAIRTPMRAFSGRPRPPPRLAYQRSLKLEVTPGRW